MASSDKNFRWGAIAAIALVLSAALPAPAQPANSAWPMFRHDAQHSGLSPYVGSQKGSLKWKYNASVFVGSSSPVLGADGTLFVAADDGTVHAIDGSTGARKWTRSLASCIGNMPMTAAVTAAEAVLIACGPNITALDGTTGDDVWWHAINFDRFLTPPTIAADGTVYIGAEQAGLYALDAATGAEKWNASTMHTLGAPSIGPGPSGSVFLVDFGGLDNGSLVRGSKPKQEEPSRLQGALLHKAAHRLSSPGGAHVPFMVPVATPTHACDLCDMSDLHAFDPQTGDQLWCYQLVPVDDGGGLSSTPAVDQNGTTYVTYEDSFGAYVIAVDGSSGTLKWTSSGTGNMHTSPGLGPDGTVYLASDSSTLTAINGTNGMTLWSFGAGVWANPTSSPAIGADATVYIGSGDNSTYAIDGKTGALKWRYETGAPIVASAAIGADGTVFIVSTDGFIYAFL